MRLRTSSSRRSTTSSCVRPSVSTSTASSARSKGPTSRGVFVVAPLLGGQDLFECCRLAALLQVVLPPAGPFFRAGREKDLALGLGKDDRSLVAAFRHDVLPCGHGPLQVHEVGANLRMIGGIARHGRYRLRPHGVGHVLALQKNSRPPETRRSKVGASSANCSGRFQSTPACNPANATARYMAPVSR